jgi:hypothetical protein
MAVCVLVLWLGKKQKHKTYLAWTAEVSKCLTFELMCERAWYLAIRFPNTTKTASSLRMVFGPEYWVCELTVFLPPLSTIPCYPLFFQNSHRKAPCEEDPPGLAISILLVPKTVCTTRQGRSARAEGI